MTYCYVWEDSHYWKNCETGQLVPFSRHQDPCFSAHFNADYPYPAVVPHTNRPKSGDNNWRINQAWWDFWKALVLRYGGEDAWNAARRNNGGIINWAANQNYPGGVPVPDPPDNGWPVMEGVTTAGNYHETIAFQNGSYKLKAFLFSDGPPDLDVVNPDTHPELFIHFRGISKEGVLGNAPDGYVVWVPLVVKEQCWIPEEKLNVGVELPGEVAMNLPLWRDYSRWQGQVNYDVALQNGVKAAICRSSISWGYQDSWFPRNWAEAGRVGMYRSSYHVIYPGEDVVRQLDNWYQVHPTIDVIPRVIDFELDQGIPNNQKADNLWDMSEKILARDGIRPIIYSRRLLVNNWLSSWTWDMLNSHYWWLAQYYGDGQEHGYADGSEQPDLPANVDRARLILHQTSDTLPGFPGESESSATDYNRWQTPDMDLWIANNFGGSPPPPSNDWNDALDAGIVALQGLKT